MATIRKRTKADGTFSYQAAIVIKKDGVIVHRESKTFAKHKIAKDWGMRKEVELQEQEVYKKRERLPIKKVIEMYLSEFNQGRSKTFDLKKLMTRDIALIDVNKLSARDLIQHTKERNNECSPQTAANDLIWLKSVLQSMQPSLNFDLDFNIFSTARKVLKNEGLIAASHKRDRLPTPRELLMLTRYLDKPTRTCMWFALYSARRQSEITRLEWGDIDHNGKTLLVRDLKHPTIKKLHKRAKLPKSAYKIIMKQEKTSKYIFPYNPRTIGHYFANACQMLGIEDLRWHDTRHAALTFYASKGLTISELRLISLHADYSSLQRYINLDPANLDV